MRKNLEKIFLMGLITLLVISIPGCELNKNNNNNNTINSNNDRNNLTNKDTAKTKDEEEYELGEDGIIEPESAKEIIEETSDKLIRAIKEKDIEAISKFTHPVKGVRFTPYTYVSPEEDISFNKEEIKNFFKDQNIYLWGVYDGIGDDILLTPGEYYEEFIYSYDFKNAKKVGYNEVLSSGNTVENQFEVYENPIIVEYYFPGLVPEYGGTDWKGLRLVFERFEKEWKLVGIIHSQWTI